MSRIIIIKTTTGECQIQNYCQEVPQSERLLGSATNKITSRKSLSNKLLRRITDKKLSVSIAIKKTAQLKGLPGSAAIKSTAKEYYNQMNFRVYYNQKDCNIQNDCQGVPQSTEMLISGSTRIKMTARINHNQKEYQGVSQSK